jgi:hypothetical protein
MNITEHVAINEKFPVGVFSLGNEQPTACATPALLAGKSEFAKGA